MKILTGKSIDKLESPYGGISLKVTTTLKSEGFSLSYFTIQQKVAKLGLRMCVSFDGRDAAGKGLDHTPLHAEHDSQVLQDLRARRPHSS